MLLNFPTVSGALPERFDARTSPATPTPTTHRAAPARERVRVIRGYPPRWRAFSRALWWARLMTG